MNIRLQAIQPGLPEARTLLHKEHSGIAENLIENYGTEIQSVLLDTGEIFQMARALLRKSIKNLFHG